jgi:hypothetical protein
LATEEATVVRSSQAQGTLQALSEAKHDLASVLSCAQLVHPIKLQPLTLIKGTEVEMH